MIAEVQEIFTSYIIIIKKPKKQNHTFFEHVFKRRVHLPEMPDIFCD